MNYIIYSVMIGCGQGESELWRPLLADYGILREGAIRPFGTHPVAGWLFAVAGEVCIWLLFRVKVRWKIWRGCFRRCRLPAQ